MFKLKNEKAITLIALVITIIILLILAGITINLALGDDGIITRAREVARNYEEVHNKELADLKEFGEELGSIIEGEVTNGDTPTIIIENLDEWTRSKKVTISANSKYITKYTTDGTEPSKENGEEYKNTFTVDKNCIVKAVYISSTNKVGNIVEKEINKIDTVEPSVLEIELIPGKKSIDIKVNKAEDGAENNESGKSDIAGYRFSKDGTNWTEYQEGTTYKFDNLYGNLSGETYTIKVEVKDKAGNTKVVENTATTTCKNTNFYCETKDDIICETLSSSRIWYKYNNIGAIIGVMYSSIDDEKWARPVLVSTEPEGVKYYTSHLPENIIEYKFTLEYNGTTYYVSNHLYSMTGELKSKYYMLNTVDQRYMGTSDNTMKAAAKDLLDKYFAE